MNKESFKIKRNETGQPEQNLHSIDGSLIEELKNHKAWLIALLNSPHITSPGKRPTFKAANAALEETKKRLLEITDEKSGQEDGQ